MSKQIETRTLKWALILAFLFSRSSFAATIVCDGDDVTPDLQLAVMDAADNNEPVLLTEGTCVINSTIEICNTDGLRIEGAGRAKTILQWETDAEDGPMFKLQNSAGVAFAEFSACVHDPDNQGVTLNSFADLYNSCFDCIVNGVQECDPGNSDYYPGAPPHSHANSFTNIEIGNCTPGDGALNYGVRIKLFGERADLAKDAVNIDGCGPASTDDHEDLYVNDPDDWLEDLYSDCYNEHHSFTSVSVNGFRKSAFVIEGLNSLGNTFTDVHCDGSYVEFAGPGQALHRGSGEICVETGQNHWVDRGDPIGYQHEHVFEWAEIGRSTAGHFNWYGGSAKNISESVFVLGYSSQPVNIFGLHAEMSRALVKALAHEIPRAGLSLVIDSVEFATDGVHAWDEQFDLRMGPNEYGIIVEMPYHGPLVMRNNLIGDFLRDPNEQQTSPSNVSLLFTFSDNPIDDPGAFLFEGNAICTSNPNPFLPIKDDGAPHEYKTPLYPTTQIANLACAAHSLEDGSVLAWETMPQHYTTIDSVLLQADGTSNSMDISRLPTSHQFFITAAGESLSIGRLLGGVIGQELFILCEGQGSLDVVHNLYPATDEPGELYLRGGINWNMAPEDVLMLVLDEDGFWREVSRGANN